MKLSKGEILAIVGILLIGAIYLGYITVPGLNIGNNNNQNNNNNNNNGGNTNPTTHADAQFYLQVADYISGAEVTTADVKVDFAKASNGIFDLLTQYDTFTFTGVAGTAHSNAMTSDGAAVLMHTSCTGDPASGKDYYDGWYYTTAHEGSPVYAITPANLVQVSGSPHYTYSVSTSGASQIGTVSWTSGLTPYWNLGKLYIYPRTIKTGFNMYVMYGGTTLNNVTDGSSWATNASPHNVTLAGSSEHLQFIVTMNTSGLTWGFKNYGVSVQGQFVTYGAYIVFTTNMTTIDVGQLQNEGWGSISDSTLYSEKAFYMPIGPWYTTKGTICAPPTIAVPVYYSGAAVGRYIFRFYIMDMQLSTNVPIGAESTTMPTAYGMMSQYGPGESIQARPYTVSSGAGTAPAIVAWVDR